MIIVWRIIKNGFKNFARNGVLSLASTTVMLLTLLSFSFFYIASSIINSGIDYVRNKIDISAFLDYDADEATVLQIQNEIATLPEVKTIKYVSQDEALERFKEQRKDQKELIEAIESLSENPLQASLEIKMNDPEKIENVASILEKEEYDSVIAKDENGDKKISYRENKIIVDKLLKITRTVKIVGISAIAAFGIVSFIIIYNTIRIAIFSQKDDIEIMKLVGATNRYVRWPFIIEGSLYGILATLISVSLIGILMFRFGPSLNEALIREIGTNTEVLFSNKLTYFLLGQLLIGIAIGSISSWLAIRKYLKEQY